VPTEFFISSSRDRDLPLPIGVNQLPHPIGGKTVYHTGPLIGPDSKGFEI
jgi:hypothetical protein